MEQRLGEKENRKRGKKKGTMRGRGRGMIPPCRRRRKWKKKS